MPATREGSAYGRHGTAGGPLGRRPRRRPRRAGRLLYRSNLLGADKRITNYGGGNTSAKLQATDPLTGEPVDRALGQGLGRRSRLDEARRLRDALSGQARAAEGALSRDRARGRDGGLPAPLHLRPQPARRQHRHAAARLPALPPRRPRPPRRGDRDRRLGAVGRADPRDLRRRDRLAALAAAGLRPRAEARGDRQGEPAPGRLRARRARAVHLGRRTARPATRPRCGSSSRRRTGWMPTTVPPRSAGRGSSRCRRPSARPVDAQPAAAAARADRRRRAQGRPCRRFAGGAGVRELEPARGAGGAGHLLPRPFPAHQDPPAGGAGRRRRRGARPADRGLPAGLCRLLRALPACRQPGDARPERGRLPRPWRRHADLRPRQGDGADRRRVLRQRDQRHARRGRRRPLCRPRRAGGLRHRVLAARGGEAAAPAQAQGAGRAGGAGHRRCRRDRRCGGAPAARRGRLRRADRHRRRGAGRGRAARWCRRPAATWCMRFVPT